MKNIICSLFVFLCLGSSVVNAQLKEVKQVEQAVEKLKAALISGDEADLKAITTANLSYGHSSGKVEDQKTFIETLTSGHSDFVSIDLSDQTVQVSGNTAIVRHTLSASTNDSGKPGTVKLGIMLVWQKQGGQWKLLARQAFKI